MVKLDRKRRVVNGRAASLVVEHVVDNENGPFTVLSVPLKVRPMVTVANPGEPERGSLVRVALPPDAPESEKERARAAAEAVGAVAVKVTDAPRRGLAERAKAVSIVDALKSEVENVPEGAREAVRKIVEGVAGRFGL